MDRIGPAGGTPTVALTNGQLGFQNANLATGTVGTTVVAAFMNAIQEELMTILAAASVTPNIANFGQVLASLQTLFGGGGTLSTAGWQKLPGGLILQWMVVNTSTGDTPTSFALPVTYPTQHLFATGNVGSTISADDYDVGVAVNNAGAVYVTNSNPTGTGQGVSVISLGH